MIFVLTIDLFNQFSYSSIRTNDTHPRATAWRSGKEVVVTTASEGPGRPAYPQEGGIVSRGAYIGNVPEYAE